MEDTALCEIHVRTKGKIKKMFLQTMAKDEGREGFYLTLTDGLSAWEGKISEDDLDELCSKSKIDFNSFVKETVAAFTQKNIGAVNFEFQLKESGNSTEFTWKKYVLADEIRFQLGSVLLQKVKQFDAKIGDVLSFSINLAKELQSTIKNLECENERLSHERLTALKRLEKCVSAKEELEQELYSKFVALLNSKKEEIRNLKENGATLDHKGRCIEERKIDSKEKRDANSPSLFEESPDEEISKPNEGKKAKVVSKKQMESSLNLGEEDEELTSIPKSRTKRKTAVKKDIPVKPTLPRVSSGVSSKSSAQQSMNASRRTSLRKSGSQASNKSSDNLDPDDLMLDM